MDIRDRVIELRKVPANEFVEILEVDIDGAHPEDTLRHQRKGAGLW